jgi:hypothetical protein
VLPYVISFCDEYNSRYSHLIVSRIGVRRYVLSRLLSASISGGVAVALPVAILALVCCVYGVPTIDPAATPLSDTFWRGMLGIWEGRFVVLMEVPVAFLFGMVWMTVGLAVSSFIPNRYASLSIPFLLYFALFLILYRLRLVIISPVNMILPHLDQLPSLLYVIAYQGILLLAASAAFLFRAAGRLRNA